MHEEPYPGDLVRDLASFLVVLAKAPYPGAFDAAAHELAVDRSVVRRRLSTLRAWVGADLIQGRGPRMRATAAGHHVAKHAQSVLASARALRAETHREPVKIAVGCTGTIATELLPNVIARSAREKDAPLVTVRRTGTALCRQMLTSGDLDMGISRSVNKPAASTMLCEDRLLLVVPRQHGLASRKLTLARFADATLVLYGPQSRTRARVMERLARRNTRVGVEVDGKAAAFEYVRRGLGIGFISAVPWYRPAVRGIVLRDVSTLFPRVYFQLEIGAGRSQSAAVQHFSSLILDEAKKRLRGAEHP